MAGTLRWKSGGTRTGAPWAVGVAVTLLLAPTLPTAASTLPTGFQEEVALSGLTYPTTFEFAADGRVFVAEKSGIIRVYDGLGDPTPTVFADLRTQVYNFWDRGLLGLALHPDFPQTPWVYVLYAYDALPGGTAPHWGQPGATSDPCPTPPGPTGEGCVVMGRLSRLTASGNVSTEEQALLTDWCQQYPSHSVGSLAFGPDGALYVSGGDGASFNWVDYGQAGNPKNPCGDPPAGVGGTMSPPSAEGGALRAQDVRTLGDPVGFGGAILRLDPETGGPMAGNPLLGGSPEDDRIVAFGFRNPFRFSIRPGTSELWIGDVGWSSWEEINRVPLPTATPIRNFGWPCYEGSGIQAGYAAAGLSMCSSLYSSPGSVSAPFFAWAHGKDVVPGDPCGPLNQGSSAGNIAFYSGGTWPAEYVGALFFTDYNRKCIWRMWPNGAGDPNPATVQTFAALNDGAVELKTGPGGDLYWADFNAGVIRRIRYFSDNAPPVAVIAATPKSGPAPLHVALDASGSTDANPADVLAFAWDLDGDGAFDDATGAQASHDYTAGVWFVTVRVTDLAGAWDTATIEIVSNDMPPTVVITAPDEALTYAVGTEIVYAAEADDAQDGALGDEAFTWELVQHHCDPECHAHVLETVEGESGGVLVAPDHDFPSHLELSVSVVDSAGLTATATRLVYPQTVVLTLQTDPPGLEVASGSKAAAAPLALEVIVGSVFSVSAPTPQDSGGVWKWAGWSDGGEASHLVTAPAEDLTLTATYMAACGDGVRDPWEGCDAATACCTAECTLDTGPPCDDGNPCTVDDVCHKGVCVGGSAVQCQDGNRCTDDWCDRLAGCLSAWNAALCSDGDACTTGDQCTEGACVGSPVVCTDGNPCTSDACLGGKCRYTANEDPCDDGNACTEADACFRGTCLGKRVDCDDGVACTTDTCVAGGCVNTWFCH